MRVVLNDGSVTDAPEVAEKIAANMRKSGYPTVTAAEVESQLSKPGTERGIVGMFAYGMLEEAHLIPDLP
jgi:hypothetical protein